MKVQKHLPVVSASGLKVLDLLNKHFFFTTRAPSVGENGTIAQPTLNPQSEAEFKAARKPGN